MLTASAGAVILSSATTDVYLSSNGNVAPELFRCVCALKVRGKLVGAIALGRRAGEATYEEDSLAALEMIASYVALAIQNYTLTQTLAQRVSENLRLLASLHGFYDNALEAFATAIDVKHVNIHGHSLRVGRYAQAIGEALGMEPGEVAPLRSAGYLHDIGNHRALTSTVFGLLVHNVGLTSSSTLLTHLRTRLKQKHKKSYTVTVGRLKPAKLANFEVVECWVLIGCREGGLVDDKEYGKPIITPFELLLALDGEKGVGEVGSEEVDAGFWECFGL